MKEIIQEYGGAILAVVAAGGFLSMLFCEMAENGALAQLFGKWCTMMY